MIFLPLPGPACWSDVVSLTVVRPRGGPLFRPAYRLAGGPPVLVSSGPLSIGAYAIELGVLVDPGQVLDVQSDVPPPGLPGSVDAWRVQRIWLARQADTWGQCVSMTDEGAEECPVDENGEPIGDPGEDYQVASVSGVGLLYARFVAWSGRNL